MKTLSFFFLYTPCKKDGYKWLLLKYWIVCSSFVPAHLTFFFFLLFLFLPSFLTFYLSVKLSLTSPHTSLLEPAFAAVVVSLVLHLLLELFSRTDVRGKCSAGKEHDVTLQSLTATD